MIRWIGLGLAGIVFAASLYWAAVLVAAHHAIRQIDPELPPRDALLEATSAPGGPVSLYYINTASQPFDAETTLGHPAFLLEWEGGRRLLIDTGMEPDEAVGFGRPLEILKDAEPTTPHGSVAEQLGSQSSSIDAIVLTHLHPDHTQGAIALCRNRDNDLSLLQTPLQSRERNYTTEMGADDLREAACLAPAVLSGGPIYRVPSFPGLVAVAAGGHTPGSTLYFANVAGHLWIFSGDITNSRAELIGNIPKESLYSLLIVPEAPERLETLRTWLAQWDRDPRHTVVVSHDLEALEASGIPAWSNDAKRLDSSHDRTP